MIPAQCVGPAPLPTDACVPEVARAEFHSAAQEPACGAVSLPMDSADLALSTTTAASFVISVQVLGKHWPTVVTSIAAVSLDAHHS